ncbi:MAG: transporter [Bacteroidales bacterium]|nr:transporter [Bacteroidales bacterium]
MKTLKTYILPIAIVAALLLHNVCYAVAPLAPVLIFCILLLNFSAINLKQLRPRIIDLWLILFQLIVSMAGFLLFRLCGANPVIAYGFLLAVLCPVAASSPVVGCLLGADRNTMTTYTIVGNIVISVAAPAYFSLLHVQEDFSFLQSFWAILCRIGPTLGLPFFVVWLLQTAWPLGAAFLRRWHGISFYLWAVALLITLGQTFHYLFNNPTAPSLLVILGLLALGVCFMQFALGRRLGAAYGDKISGGQLLGQKNSAMGIWMANTYLDPLTAVTMAFYSIYQNIFNSYQLWQKNRATNN